MPSLTHEVQFYLTAALRGVRGAPCAAEADRAGGGRGWRRARRCGRSTDVREEPELLLEQILLRMRVVVLDERAVKTTCSAYSGNPLDLWGWVSVCAFQPLFDVPNRRAIEVRPDSHRKAGCKAAEGCWSAVNAPCKPLE